MDKQHIIDEIRRTARANKGVALGWRRFETETGIKYSDWYGKFWTRWGDAVREAGLQANRMGEPFADEVLLEKLINLTRQLGRVPVQGDVLMARRKDPAFPSEKVFRRFGSKPQRATRVIAYCIPDSRMSLSFGGRFLRNESRFSRPGERRTCSVSFI